MTIKPFDLPETTAVACTSINVRREFHGDVTVHAFDLKFRWEGPGTILDRIKPGLRHEYFHDASAKKGQKALLADQPLPNLRRPEVNNEGVAWEKGSKSRGYRFQLDWGIEETAVDLTDAVMYGVTFDCFEGDRAAIEFGVQYNGDELSDANVKSMLLDMLLAKAVHIRLLAPPELLKVAKGYRAGHKDTPQTLGDGNPNQQQLSDGAQPEGSEGSELGVVEGAFIATGGPAVH